MQKRDADWWARPDVRRAYTKGIVAQWVLFALFLLWISGYVQIRFNW